MDSTYGVGPEPAHRAQVTQQAGSGPRWGCRAWSGGDVGGDGQGFQAAVDVGAVAGWVVLESGVDQPAGQGGEGDLALQAGQRAAEAGMDAGAEGEVTGVGAVDVEP